MGGDGLLASALTQYPDDVDILDGTYATDFFSYDMPATAYGKEISRAFRSLYEDKGTTYAGLGAEAH